MKNLSEYIRFFWRICGRPVMEIDELYRQMIQRAGWRPFIIERVK